MHVATFGILAGWALGTSLASRPHSPVASAELTLQDGSPRLRRALGSFRGQVLTEHIKVDNAERDFLAHTDLDAVWLSRTE
jgi:hypothetical protein